MPDGPLGLLVLFVGLVICCIPVVIILHMLGGLEDRWQARKNAKLRKDSGLEV